MTVTTTRGDMPPSQSRAVGFIELSKYFRSQTANPTGYGHDETDSGDCSAPCIGKMRISMRNAITGDEEVQQFLKGPVPLHWLQAAARLPGRSLHVGMVLWYVAGHSGSVSVHLSNTLCLRFGFDRNAKYRALRSLMDARLVAIKRKRGHSPQVTILDRCDGYDE